MSAVAVIKPSLKRKYLPRSCSKTAAAQVLVSCYMILVKLSIPIESQSLRRTVINIHILHSNSKLNQEVRFIAFFFSTVNSRKPEMIINTALHIIAQVKRQKSGELIMLPAKHHPKNFKNQYIVHRTKCRITQCQKSH